MIRTDPRTMLPLTPAMLHVLLALADGDKHGYAIIKEVTRRTAGDVQLGAGTLFSSGLIAGGCRSIPSSATMAETSSSGQEPCTRWSSDCWPTT